MSESFQEASASHKRSNHKTLKKDSGNPTVPDKTSLWLILVVMGGLGVLAANQCIKDKIMKNINENIYFQTVFCVTSQQLHLDPKDREPSGTDRKIRSAQDARRKIWAFQNQTYAGSAPSAVRCARSEVDHLRRPKGGRSRRRASERTSDGHTCATRAARTNDTKRCPGPVTPSCFDIILYTKPSPVETSLRLMGRLKRNMGTATK